MSEQYGAPYCSGTLVEVIIDGNKPWHYHSPTNDGYVAEKFMLNEQTQCTYDYTNSAWGDNCGTPKNWSVIMGTTMVASSGTIIVPQNNN